MENTALITAVLGEIGNNCFDHNVGLWTDIPGAYFHYNLTKDFFWAVISDRWQGLFSSLSRVVPNLRSAQEAIDIAFHKRITGRQPEQRGNGLKFVRETLNFEQGRGLFFQTDGASHTFGDLGTQASDVIKPVHVPQGPDGSFAFLVWVI